MKKEKFDIDGMRCSSCAAHVEKTVSKLEGVKSVNVNLLSNSMMVEYNEKKINNDTIIKAVIDAGFGAKIGEEVRKEKNNIDEMKQRLIISICFLIPLMLTSFSAVLQFILLLPIVYVNRSYFLVGFKRLFKGQPNMDSLIAIGSGAAIIYSLFGHSYFESAGMILTLITVRKILRNKVKSKNRSSNRKANKLSSKNFYSN